MLILAIDPGPEQSGWVAYNTGKHVVAACGIEPASVICAPMSDILMLPPEPGSLCRVTVSALVIEQIKCYGMPMGDSTINTAVVIGRFLQAWGDDTTSHLIPRATIKAQLCGSARAKDKNVRQALKDRFPATGRTTKGEPSSIGTQKHPGPLHGVTGHMWSALAVAVAWAERHEQARGE